MPPEAVVAPVLGQYLALMESLTVPWPVFAMLSLARAENYKLAKSEHGFTYHVGNPLAQPTIALPEVELLRDPDEALRALRSVFDILWQTFGEPRSPRFDEHGNYLRGAR